MDLKGSYNIEFKTINLIVQNCKNSLKEIKIDGENMSGDQINTIVSNFRSNFIEVFHLYFG